MKRAVLFLTLACLTGAARAAPGTETAAADPAANAMAAGLWEVAALRYERQWQDAALEAGPRAESGLRLAEAWLRMGRPAEALALLENSILAPHPETTFWQAQALAGLGRFGEAAEALARHLSEPAAPHAAAAAYTRANLLLSLGKSHDALETLETFASRAATGHERTEALLRKTAILLDAGQADAARSTLAGIAEPSSAQRPFARLLEARLLLAEGRAAEAATAFAALLDQPQGQTFPHFQMAAIGLADALHAQGNPSANDGLLQFIQNHPEAPMLDAMFRRILDNLPERPAPSHPLFERLADWIPPPSPAGPAAIHLDDRAVSAWPAPPATGDRAAFALFTRAILFHRLATPEGRAEAGRLMRRLISEFPEHFLATRALLETARWQLPENPQAALRRLDAVAQSARSPLAQAEADFLHGRTLAADPAADPAEAIARFEQAAEMLTGEASRAARFNAALLRLRAEGPDALSPILTAANAAGDRSLAADLLLEQALAMADPRAAAAALDNFLTRHPDHPRAAEARLAAAEAAMACQPPDLSAARAQLEFLSSAADPDYPTDPPTVPAPRLALLRLRIAEAAGETSGAETLARDILSQFPAEPEAAEAALSLGRLLFQSGSYHDARLVLEKLALTETDPLRAQAAWLLAARAAARGATAQSREQALGLFDKAAELDAKLGPAVRLEKARLLIDLNRLDEAAALLRDWTATLPEADPLRLPAGFLLGEALYARSAQSPESLAEALAVYDDLLALAQARPALLHRLQYLRGMILERLPLESDPSRTREAEALDAYYSVLENAGNEPPAEWEWFENCGFRAFEVLEKAERWKAAIAVARKIASFNGPRAKDAATRADKLRDKQMIWED